MIDFQTARDRMLQLAQPLEPTSAPLRDILGLVASEDVRALHEVPPFTNSAMDGYAVRFEGVADASMNRPTRLKVLEFLAAGTTAAAAVEPGTAMKIMTGAPMPPGADAVVMVEVTREENGEVLIGSPVRKEENVRAAGEDMKSGEIVVHEGQEMIPARIGLCAAVGHAKVPVFPRPRVGIVITGDELVEPGEPLSPGKIHNSNAYSLYAQVLETGAVPVEFGVVPDDREGLVKVFSEAFATCHVVASSGGVSMGDLDMVEEAAGAVGARLLFDAVAQKPGKPLVGGQAGNTLFFGLPGNPVSVMVCFEVYVRPVLRKMMGHRELFRPRATGYFPKGYRKKPGRMEWVRVRVREREGDGLLIEPSAPQGSGILRSMVLGQGLAEVPKEVSELGPSDPVTVHLFEG